MRNRDFGACYAALELPPGATDQEIARAKRAYNELYHSDRLAHMSDQARAIASAKVQAANAAAQALLDPGNRASRDLWVLESRRAEQAADARDAGNQEPETAAAADWGGQPGWTPAPPPAARAQTGRLIVIGLATGALLTTLGTVIRSGAWRTTVPAPAVGPLVVSDTAAALATQAVPAPRKALPARPTTMMDSLVVLPGDGRWTRPVAAGSASFRTSFVPESDGDLYRVRIDGNREVVLLGEPGFRKLSAPARQYQFASLTGQPVRLRFSRWRLDGASGATVHRLAIELPPDGSWSRRLFLGDLTVRWEPDRAVSYEARDNRGRVMHILPSVGSVFSAPYPEWIQFRSVDSLPLTLTVQYTVR